VELAIVPPTPIRLVGECTGIADGGAVAVGDTTAHFPVIEHVVGGREVVGLMSAGLWGDGMPMMKGMLLLDAELSFRGGDAGAAVLDAAEPARERRARGAGIAVVEPDELVRERWLFERPRRVERDAVRGSL
jgi:hypothetical protein